MEIGDMIMKQSSGGNSYELLLGSAFKYKKSNQQNITDTTYLTRFG